MRYFAVIKFLKLQVELFSLKESEIYWRIPFFYRTLIHLEISVTDMNIANGGSVLANTFIEVIKLVNFIILYTYFYQSSSVMLIHFKLR